MATTSKPNESGLSQGGTGTQEITQRAKEAAKDVAGVAKEKLSGKAESERERAASSIGSVAEALRRTGDEIGEESPFSDYLGKAAEGVERVGEYFRSKDLGEIVEDVEDFARREPALFLGAAFTAGLLGARFLKSSSQRRTGRLDRSYGRSYGRSYDRGYDRGYDYRARDVDARGPAADRFAPPTTHERPAPVAGAGAAETRPGVPGLGTPGAGTGGRP